MFTISVCMIVKNEEKVLGRILSCAEHFADEIIVVDTGSTDGTKDVAKKYTDKIFDFKWVDDFSKARNFSFEKATCDFQMWLDADDFIDQENIQKILNLKKSDQNPDVFMFKYVFDNLTYFRERLLKRSKNFKWQGFVHEVIAPCGEIKFCDIEILHKKERPPDPKRNLKLYRKAIKRSVILSPRETYYYARELYYNRFFTKASKEFKKFIKCSNTFPPDDLCAHMLLAECFCVKNQFDRALDTLFLALKKHLPTSELCCRIGYVFKFKNDLPAAIFWFKCALMCEKQTSGFVNKDFQDIIPLLELVSLCFKVGRHDEAKFYHSQCKALRPDHPSVVYNDAFFSKK